jgi:hypothetical protein
MRLRVRRFHWQAGVRLCAAHRPAMRCELRQVAHLGASRRGLGHRAVAVAAAGRWLIELSGSVGPRGRGQNATSDEQIEDEPDSETAKAIEKERWHDKQCQRPAAENR